MPGYYQQQVEPECKSQQRKDLPKAPRFVVTLIHGTFARKASWIQPGSTLQTSLQMKLGGSVEFIPYQWSGGNSHKSRLDAGHKLAHFMQNTIATYPQSEHYIIAHSHG